MQYGHTYIRVYLSVMLHQVRSTILPNCLCVSLLVNDVSRQTLNRSLVRRTLSKNTPNMNYSENMTHFQKASGLSNISLMLYFLRLTLVGVASSLVFSHSNNVFLGLTQVCSSTSDDLQMALSFTIRSTSKRDCYKRQLFISARSYNFLLTGKLNFLSINERKLFSVI